MTKKEQKAAEVAANKFAAFNKRVSTLLGHVYVTSDQCKQAYEAKKSADEFAADIASLEPVGKALHPLKVDAVASATKSATARVETITEDLKANGWDIEKAAPYPADRMPSYQYFVAKMKYNTYHSVVSADETRNPGYHRPGEPNFVKINPKRVAQFINEAEHRAAFEYDAFICKMVSKVGVCDDAKIVGNHVWSHSILTVTKGEKQENWKTQQIWNVSKLGKHFPQWPSRLMK